MAREKANDPESKRGRKDYYTDRIKPRLNEIKEWCAYGLNEEQIYRNLGIGKTTWYKYKAEKPELQEAIKTGSIPLVIKVRSALVNSALGYTYTEKKTYIKQEPDGTGKIKPVSYEEITERYAQPNVASCNLLLKNLDRDNWANDPQSLKMRQLELKHKEQVAKNNVFMPVESENE